MKLLGFHRGEAIQRPADDVDTERIKSVEQPSGGP